ncbi:MAG: trypsin-like serine protease [Bacillota bacterium]
MFKSFFLLIGIAALLVSCADSSGTHDQVAAGEFGEATGIIGGTEAPDRSPLTNRVLSLIVIIPQAPTWQEGGMVVPQVRVQCTAVALTKRVVLTAAHCWNSNPRSYYAVHVPDPSGQTVEIAVVDKKIHERFRLGSYEYDLALLRLEKDLPANIEMARLPQFKDQIQPLYINAAGFGKSVGMKSSDKGVGVLRIATLMVRDYGRLSTSFEVDQRAGKGICQGDSGGPAYAQFQGKTYVVGIVSRSRGQENSDNIHRNICDDAGFYIKVDNNLSWIKQYTAALNSGLPLKPSAIESVIH